MNEESRLRKNANVRERNRAAYRLAHGIPLNAPLSKRGVKRGSSPKDGFQNLPPLVYYWEK